MGIRTLQLSTAFDDSLLAYNSKEELRETLAQDAAAKIRREFDRSMHDPRIDDCRCVICTDSDFNYKKFVGIDYSKLESRSYITMIDTYRKELIGHFKIPREVLMEGVQETCGCIVSMPYRNVEKCRYGHYNSAVAGWIKPEGVLYRSMAAALHHVAKRPADSRPDVLDRVRPPPNVEETLLSPHGYLEKRVAKLEMELNLKGEQIAELKKLVQEQEARLRETVSSYSCKKCGARFGEQHGNISHA